MNYAVDWVANNPVFICLMNAAIWIAFIAFIVIEKRNKK